MILAGAHASRDDLARFQREAEAAAQLQHPNVVQVYEIGQQQVSPRLRGIPRSLAVQGNFLVGRASSPQPRLAIPER